MELDGGGQSLLPPPVVVPPIPLASINLANLFKPNSDQQSSSKSNDCLGFQEVPKVLLDRSNRQSERRRPIDREASGSIEFEDNELQHSSTMPFQLDKSPEKFDINLFEQPGLNKVASGLDHIILEELEELCECDDDDKDND